MAADGGSEGRNSGSRVAEATFQWVSSSPTPAEVERLEDLFPDVVQVPVAELAAETLGWQQRAVLMRTFHRWVPVEAFIREFRRGGISGEIFPISLAFRSYIFRFADEEARDMVLQRPWVINGQPAASEAWRPEFVPAADAISSALLWIRLPNLPIEFWREEILREIIAPAGQFVCVDSATQAKNRGGFARVCVRVDLGSPLRPGVRVRGTMGPFWQQFVFEQLEGICQACGSIHLSGSCSSPTWTASESSSEASLFGSWMSAVRQRKVPKGSQVEGRGKVQAGTIPVSPGSRPSSVNVAPDSGMTNDGWTSQRKMARRRRGSGLKAATVLAGSSGQSSGTKEKVASVAGKELKASERAGLMEGVPVSAELQKSETFQSISKNSNPFASLDPESGGVSLLGSRDACPGPLKRARPAEYQAPRLTSRLDKKKGKAKLVQVQVMQCSRVDLGSDMVHQAKISVGEKTQPTMASGSSCDPLTSVFRGQGPGPRASDTSPPNVGVQDVMICCSQNPEVGTRSSGCHPDSDMVEMQGEIPASSSC